MNSQRTRTWAEIDLSAIAHNFHTLWRGEGKRAIIAVVKADAYGHGAVEVAARLAAEGATMFAVATISEAAQLRASGIETPILLLGAYAKADCEDILDLGLMPSVSSAAFAADLDQAARARGASAPVHIQIDSGMGRLGIPAARAVEAIEKIYALENLVLEGIYTHLAESEAEDKSFTIGQLGKFGRVVATLEGMGITFKYHHAANSAGCLDVPESLFDCVRPGLSLYGMHPGPMCARDVELRPALRLCTRVVNIETRPAGATIGYNRTHRLLKETPVAVLSAGYADGYDRRLSDRAVVTIGGKDCPVLGRISMDFTSVDTSAVPQVAVGDEAVLFSTAPDAPNCIERLSEMIGTIPHVLMCNISKRVPRVYKR